MCTYSIQKVSKTDWDLGAIAQNAIVINGCDWELKNATFNLNHWVKKVIISKKVNKVKSFCEWKGSNCIEWVLHTILICIRYSKPFFVYVSLIVLEPQNFFYNFLNNFDVTDWKWLSIILVWIHHFSPLLIGLSTGRAYARYETDPTISSLQDLDLPPTDKRSRFGWVSPQLESEKSDLVEASHISTRSGWISIDLSTKD